MRAYLTLSFSPWRDVDCTWFSRSCQRFKLGAEEKYAYHSFLLLDYFVNNIFRSLCGVGSTGFITAFFLELSDFRKIPFV